MFTGSLPPALRLASRALVDSSAVGFFVDDFPDHSVVGHLCRMAGTAPQTFISGGALLVDPSQPAPFFPDIYNEDWLFLHNWTGAARVSSAGFARQLPYDPFAHPHRAYREEFGDILAQGLHQLLFHGTESGSTGFWAAQLAERGLRVRHALRVVDTLGLPRAVRHRIELSMRAAHVRRAGIEPASFVEFLRTWRADQRRWAARWDAVTPADSVAIALKHLDLAPEIDLSDPDRYEHRH